jgi:cytoskeletal protein CcmA (bactofilin family)
VGELQIEGQVQGNVISEGGKDARLTVHEKGVIEGEVRVANAIINGHIKGDVRVQSHLELAQRAVVNGNVYYSVIEMIKGSQVNGNLVHFDEKADSAKKSEAISIIKAKPVSV